MRAPLNPQPLKPPPEQQLHNPTPTPMTQDQDNIRTMFATTISFLDENNSVWTGTAAFADQRRDR